eukprot:COSAG05_NODE_2099_length_3561_cov_3.484691_2_plen_95_part_00
MSIARLQQRGASTGQDYKRLMRRHQHMRGNSNILVYAKSLRGAIHIGASGITHLIDIDLLATMDSKSVMVVYVQSSFRDQRWRFRHQRRVWALK